VLSLSAKKKMSAMLATNEFRISLDHGHSLFACEVTHRHHPAKTGSSTATSSSSSIKKDPAFVVIVVHGGPGVSSHKECFDGLKNLLWDSWRNDKNGL
jgi:hypothetical protein